MKDERQQVARLFESLGATSEQARVMAGQLIRRADRIAAEREVTRTEAMEELLRIVIHGRRGEVYRSGGKKEKNR